MNEPLRPIPWLDPRSADRIKVAPGDTYEFTADISTRAGHIHPKGSRLFVHDPTTDSPNDEIGPRGMNWYCRTQFGISIWTTLEHCIERGVLRKVVSS